MQIILGYVDIIEEFPYFLWSSVTRTKVFANWGFLDGVLTRGTVSNEELLQSSAACSVISATYSFLLNAGKTVKRNEFH